MSNSCFLSGNLQNLPTFTTSHNEDVASSSQEATTFSPHSTSFFYNLSILKDKVHQVESIASLFISPGPGPGLDHQQSESTAIAIANMGTLIQEIIFTSSSMMFSCSKMSSLGFGSNPSSSNHIHPPARTTDHRSTDRNNSAEVTQFGHQGKSEKVFYSNMDLDWFGDHTSYTNSNNSNVEHNNSSWNAETSTHLHSNIHTDNPTKGFHRKIESPQGFSDNPTKDFHKKIESPEGFSPRHYDIIEMEVADLLAKYTHYCQVCGKGFKRDANMRMHMRAHGDEYKSKEALSKNIIIINEEMSKPRKYSCPAEGCRWNKKHAKFQPLKSMICMKNHYKRSHCPKMYVCKRCNMKNFSVLSDLRTHEKHCGDVKWQCSCGNTFSRKDKLMGHVALFVGHTPNIDSLARMGKRDSNAVQIEVEDRKRYIKKSLDQT